MGLKDFGHFDRGNTKQIITVITTGGTIEKTYDESDGSLDNRGPAIRESILSRLRLPYTDLQVLSIMHKDSLHMTDNDRMLLCMTIKAQEEMGRPIVVLHGTDTMAKSAEVIFHEIKNPKVAIVFTGAMRPFGFIDSDANQNVTEALLASKILTPGVYIVFHNRVFKLPEVRKNHTTRTFESF